MRLWLITLTIVKLISLECACAVVSKGQIVERGDHADLIARSGGAYAALVRLQQQAPGIDLGPGKAVAGVEAHAASAAHSSKMLDSQVCN